MSDFIASAFILAFIIILSQGAFRFIESFKEPLVCEKTELVTSTTKRFEAGIPIITLEQKEECVLYRRLK